MTLRRLLTNPLLSPDSIAPSSPDRRVVSAINAGATSFKGETILLLRVAERAAAIDPPPGALTLDFTDPTLPTVPLNLSSPASPASYFDPDTSSIIDIWVPHETPGADFSDPRAISIRRSTPFVLNLDMLTQISHLRLARSTDSTIFTVDPDPALAPATYLESYGLEDPRISLIDDTYYITYVSVSKYGVTTSLASTEDFVTFDRLGVIFAPDNKDVTLFPARLGDKYFALHRPMPASFNRLHGIWLASSTDLLSWGAHQPLIMPRPGYFDSLRTGAGSAPFLTPEGWVIPYHGADEHNHYHLGVTLLDPTDPTRVLARSSSPLLSPEASYEAQGLLPQVVFSSGHILMNPELLRIYYGAADTYLAAADISLADLYAHLGL